MRWLLVVLAMGLTAAPARAEPIDDVREKLGRRLVADYEELARWCGINRLPLARARLYESVLFFVPDHAKARKTLRYRRDSRGRWVQDAGYKEPKNYNREGLKTYRERREEIAGRFTRRLRDLLEDGRVSPRARQRAVDAMIAADPENPSIRDLNGEEEDDGRWLLTESVTGRLRRKHLRLAAKAEIRSMADPKRIEPTEEEEKLGLRWLAALDGTDWRALGTVDVSEIEHALRLADASRPVVEAVFDIQARRRQHSTFYLLKGPRDAQAMLSAHPEFGERDQEYYRRLAGAWIPGTTDFIQWGARSETRLDAVVRMACSFHMAGSLAIEKKPGWAVEGVGIYLTHLLTGTRRTLLVRRTGYHEPRKDPSEKLDFWERTQMPGADWLQLARELYENRKAPDLRFLMSKDLNQLTIEDVLCAHALAAYLIEGRPDEVVPFLRDIGKGVPMDKAIGDHLRTYCEGLEARLRRWLEETKD